MDFSFIVNFFAAHATVLCDRREKHPSFFLTYQYNKASDMKLLYTVCIAVIVSACTNEPATSVKEEDKPTPSAESIFNFTKADEFIAVLVPDSSQVFVCPILKKEVKWEEKDVFNPAVVVRNDTLFLLYRAEDRIGKYAGTSRIGLAWSANGLHFNKYPQPVFYPDNDDQKKWEWEGGCEDPRVVQDEKGVYYMTYT